MGKTERRNVSQKKRSPVRTSLKLRKEKKMKGGELTGPEIDNIKNRDKGYPGDNLTIVNALLNNLESMKYYLNSDEYINQENKQIDKEKFKTDITNFVNKEGSNIIEMINEYFFDKSKPLPLDFSKKYTETINKVIPILEYILEFLEKGIKIPSSTNPDKYNQFISLYNSLNTNVVEVIQIMKAIAEGAKIKINTAEADAGDGTAAGADDKSAAATTDLAAAATTDLAAAGTAVTIPTITADTIVTSTDKSGPNEIKKLREGLVIINNIDNISKGMDENDRNDLFKQLQSIKRLINAFLIYKNNKIKNEFEKIVNSRNDSDIPFFNREDIERLLKGELIITVDNISTAQNSLNELKSNVKNDPNSLENKVIENSKNSQNELTKEEFEENIDFLKTLLGEIEKEVKKESQDTTSKTKDEINKDTNEIKETNDITIDNDEELVTLNITDQEGHIIYSYILKFTRKGEGVTIASASEIKRDPINDQYNIPTIVLTVKMNEPFTINGNRFIISN